MNAKTVNKKKVRQAILYIVIILLLIAIVGFFAYFTNGFTGDFKSFYVVCNENTVMSTGSGYHLSASEPLNVDVCYTFGFLSKEITGYQVKVIPNADFDFKVDGNLYSFISEPDITECFNIDYQEKSFTIAPKGGIDLMLSIMYPDGEIEVDKDSINFDSNLVKIIVSSVDNSTSVSLDCTLSNTAVYGVSLDQEVIVF